MRVSSPMDSLLATSYRSDAVCRPSLVVRLVSHRD